MAGFDGVISRADLLINKYAKFDQKRNAKSDLLQLRDYGAAYKRLSELREETRSIIDELSVVAIAVPDEKAAKLNAELRRNKRIILEGLEVLALLVNKGEKVTGQLIKERKQQIKELQTAALELPDAVRGKSRMVDPRHRDKLREGEQSSKRFPPPVHISGVNQPSVDGYMLETEEAKAFRQQWEKARRMQDERLEVLREELEDVQGIAEGIFSELEQQPYQMEGLQERMEHVSDTINNQNKRLKGAVRRVATPLQCCLYSTLILLVLAVGGFIYFSVAESGAGLHGAGEAEPAAMDVAVAARAGCEDPALETCPTALPTPTPTPTTAAEEEDGT